MLEGLVPDYNDEVVIQNFLCIFIFAFFATARVAKRAELRAKRFICYYIAVYEGKQIGVNFYIYINEVLALAQQIIY